MFQVIASSCRKSKYVLLQIKKDVNQGYFSPLCFVYIFFLYMVFISNLGVFEDWLFWFFLISPLIILISILFFTELVKQSPCLFFHLLISFFGVLVLPCIHCKIEIFNINKSTSMLCGDCSRFLSTLQKILLVLTTGFMKAFGLAPCQVVTVCCLCCLFQLHVVSF